jgi:hypothetical protein
VSVVEVLERSTGPQSGRERVSLGDPAPLTASDSESQRIEAQRARSASKVDSSATSVSNKESRSPGNEQGRVDSTRTEQNRPADKEAPLAKSAAEQQLEAAERKQR